MNAVSETIALDAKWDGLASIDARTLEIINRRRERGTFLRRGWLLRRLLLVADVTGLLLAFVVASVVAGSEPSIGSTAVFLSTLPAWVVLAKLHGLYEGDEERASHSTIDDLVGVFHLATLGVWLAALIAFGVGTSSPDLFQLGVFWAAVLVLVPLGRGLARGASRRSMAYIQNTIIVGAGDVGQLVARKLLQHPEYGLNLVGFVDLNPKQRRTDLTHLTLLGSPDCLPEMVQVLDVERVIVSFSSEADHEVVSLIRSLRELDVQIDLVPRLFDVVGHSAEIHSVEGLPLIGLSPVRPSRSSRFLKRALDVTVSAATLILAAPLMAYIALRIRYDSPGPVLFRQVRLGQNRRPFTVLKFRTMKVGTDESAHREYIASTMSADAVVGPNGMYKLDRAGDVTPFGRWLRRTSLDELPQLVNVLRGEMSLVGPRPCLAYETEDFRPHHFERFVVPPGITGLWQVTARANSTFGEALDMDVSYVRSWSLALDLRLLLRTPLEVIRHRSATA
jgi:exopolysaccharide biosynthesis polyprenyl glycosylphosphotransferase